MGYIDYVCNTFLVSNNKNNSKVKETQDKKLYNLLLKNMGKSSETCQDPRKVIISLSSYNLKDHEKAVLCKDLNFTVLSKAIEDSELLLPFQILFRENTNMVILIKNVSKVDFEIALIHHLSRFPRYLTKIFPKRTIEH